MSDLDPLSTLIEQIVDADYHALEARFLRSGKGRRPDITAPQLVNKVFVQLCHLNLKSEYSQSKVVKWFKHLYPDVNLGDDRLRQLIFRTYERAVRLSENQDDLCLYLEQTFNVDFVSVDLEECGLTRSILFQPDGFVCNVNKLTNKAVLDLNALQIKERLPYIFASEWISRILGYSSEGKVLKFINRKVDKLKERRKKIQTDKKASPEALTHFYNELFKDNFVLLDLSTCLNSNSKEPGAQQVHTTDSDRAIRQKLLQAEELVAACRARIKVLEAIVKEDHAVKNNLEDKLRVSVNERMKSDSVVMQVNEKICLLEKSLKRNSKKHKYSFNQLAKNYNTELEHYKGKNSLLSSRLQKAKSICRQKSKIIEKLNVNKMFSNSKTLDVAEIKGNFKNVYSDAVRETVIALQGEAGVSALNVTKVIEIVAKHLFFHTFHEPLPSAQCAINMLGEGYFISNVQVTENILKSNNVTFHSDGTSRDHKKIVGHQFTMDSGETFYLGFVPVTSEDAQTLLQLSIDCLHKLCFCYESMTGVDDVFKKVLPKITSLMTDRAAAMKSYDKKFQDFVETETGRNICIHFLHCNAHFLLGLSASCEKALTSVEELVIQNLGEALGRDKESGLFVSFLKEKSSATTRFIRTTCDILGPRGDQKNGCREQWITFCDDSKIPSFKSNRFNCFFEASAAIIFHHKKMLTFLNSGILHENPNLKIQSVTFDVKDTSLMCFVCCLALLYLKVTGPYWMLVSKSSVLYTDFHVYVKSLHFYLEKWSTDPCEILDVNFVSIFPDVSLHSNYFNAVHSFVNNNDISLIQSILKELCSACLIVTNRQLADFLSGPFLDTDEISKEQLKHCPLTNLVGESAFGDFDFDVGKRRNASLHNRSAVHCIKRNKTINFVSKKSPLCKEKLFATARRFSPVLKRQHREMEEKVKERTREMFVENQQKKIEKQMTLICKNSDIIENVKCHGGPCKTVQDLNNLLKKDFSKKQLIEALKAEIRFLKMCGTKKIKFGTTEFMIDALTSILPNEYDMSPSSSVTEHVEKRPRL